MRSTAVTCDYSMDYCSFGNGEKNFVIIPGLSLKPVTPMEKAVASAYLPLTEEYTVYMFDRRTEVPDNYTIEEMAEDTVKVIRQLGLKDIYLFGASQGGMIAQMIAVKNPGLVRKLILGSSASKPNNTTAEVIGEWIRLAKEKKGDELNIRMINDVYSPGFIEQYADAIYGATGTLSDYELEKFSTVAAPIITFDNYGRLTEISCDTLVIGSYGDRVLTGKASVEIADRLGCELFMYGKEYGHGVYDEAPDYIGHILRFISD